MIALPQGAAETECAMLVRTVKHAQMIVGEKRKVETNIAAEVGEPVVLIPAVERKVSCVLVLMHAIILLPLTRSQLP